MILIGLGLGIKYGGATLTRVLGVASVHLFHFSYLFLAMGCITILLGLAGWYGTTKESRGTLLFVSWICTQNPKLPQNIQILHWCIAGTLTPCSLFYFID
jgi:hypothetical protein